MGIYLSFPVHFRPALELKSFRANAITGKTKTVRHKRTAIAEKADSVFPVKNRIAAKLIHPIETININQKNMGF
jgi:hypothetical protein